MSTASDYHHWEGENLLLTIRVQPKSSKDEIVGTHGDALKIPITATPVDGKANSHLIKYLAKTFGVANSKVELVSGDNNRYKRLRIQSPSVLPADISRKQYP